MFTSSGYTGGRGGDAKTIISPNTSFGDIISLLGKPGPQMYSPAAVYQSGGGGGLGKYLY